MTQGNIYMGSQTIHCTELLYCPTELYCPVGTISSATLKMLKYSKESIPIIDHHAGIVTAHLCKVLDMH